MDYEINEVKEKFLRLMNMKSFEEVIVNVLSRDSLELDYYYCNIRFQARVYTDTIHLISFPSENIIFNKTYTPPEGGYHATTIIQAVEYISRFAQLTRRITTTFNTELIHLQSCLLDEV